MTQLVNYAVADGVAHIDLNRPDVANALDRELAQALRASAGRVAADEGARVVLVTGAGERFCAGGDVRYFDAAPDPAAYIHLLATEANAGIRALAGLPKPVVAGVHGAVAVAGLAIMLSCDLIVAEPGTKFSFAYPTSGLHPTAACPGYCRAQWANSGRSRSPSVAAHCLLRRRWHQAWSRRSLMT